MITFGDNISNTAVRIARQLAQVGTAEIRRAKTATVVGYRSAGGDPRVSVRRAQELRRQLLLINPNLVVRIADGGTRRAPECTRARNQCALVQLGL